MSRLSLSRKQKVLDNILEKVLFTWSYRPCWRRSVFCLNDFVSFPRVDEDNRLISVLSDNGASVYIRYIHTAANVFVYFSNQCYCAVFIYER